MKRGVVFGVGGQGLMKKPGGRGGLEGLGMWMNPTPEAEAAAEVV